MRKLKQRLFSMLLCAAMLFSLCAPAAAEEDTVEETGPGTQSVEYRDEKGETKNCTKAITVTATETAWNEAGSSSGWYVAQNSVTMMDCVTVTGQVYLILVDGCKLEALRGIDVGQGNSLTIYAQSTDENIMGKLTVASTDLNCACIGGGNGGSGGEITISGGMVEAISAGYGAGIGGGYGGNGGQITINGGKVTAMSVGGGAGIGGGDGGAGGEITINGGTVEASSRYGGAGIGGGYGGYGGEITITGGKVTAASEGRGAGIGGGCSDADSSGDGGTITISGGVVTAAASQGAGIGGGMDGASGTFITGPNGSAFIVASKIDDQSGKNDGSWSGVIFEGTEDGKVYGSEITLTTDAEISADKTLEIGEGQTLIVGVDVTLTNYGKITGSGTIKGTVVNHGTIAEGITVQGHSHQWDTAWSSDSTHHWHRCTVTGCGERSDSAAHTPGDWVIDKAATSTEAGQRHKACTVCGYVTATETIPATGGGNGGGGGEIYTPPTYKPEVSKPSQGGGTPSISPSDPARGDTVTVTPKPDEGYEVDKITVTDKNGKPVEVTKKPDGTYTFKQPSGQVTIEIEYAPVPLTDLPWNNPFTDVSESDWYYEAVRFVQESGLMNGYEDGRFAPEDTLSRAQLAQILFNKEGQPAGNGQSDFTDVSGGAWYSAAVCWAADQGIVGGYGDGTFAPNAPITREQLAVMLWRYSGSPDATDKELHFNDMGEISGFALEAMRWAVENGILNGYGDGQLGPQGQATRAQVAQMLKNFIENQEEDT